MECVLLRNVNSRTVQILLYRCVTGIFLLLVYDVCAILYEICKNTKKSVSIHMFISLTVRFLPCSGMFVCKQGSGKTRITMYYNKS